MTPAARQRTRRELTELADYLEALAQMDSPDNPELAAMIDEARVRHNDCLRAVRRLYQ